MNVNFCNYNNKYLLIKANGILNNEKMMRNFIYNTMKTK